MTLDSASKPIAVSPLSVNEDLLQKTNLLGLSLNELEAKEDIKRCFPSEDHAEALKARIEKRKPIFNCN